LGAPFHVAGAGGITALSTDGPLSTLSLTLRSVRADERRSRWDLAFLHFEAPDAEAPRAVVIVAPISQTSVAILKDVLNGFASNPFITLATLTPSFADDLVATNGAPAARSMINPVVHTTWTSHNITSLSTLVVEVNSYAPALRSTNIGNDLTVAMEASEITGTPVRARAQSTPPRTRSRVSWVISQWIRAPSRSPGPVHRFPSP